MFTCISGISMSKDLPYEQTQTSGRETGLLGKTLSGQNLQGQRTCKSLAFQKEGGSISLSRGS